MEQFTDVTAAVKEYEARILDTLNEFEKRLPRGIELYDVSMFRWSGWLRAPTIQCRIKLSFNREEI